MNINIRIVCHSFGGAVCAGAILLVVTTAPAQNLLVTEQLTGNIYEFTPDGKKNTVAFGLNPVSLACDRAGDLFVANPGTISKFTPEGTESTFADGLFPLALACDRAGDLFAADSWSGNIYEFTPDGAQSTFASGLNFNLQSAALAFNNAGDLFVWDDSSHIYEFTADGTQTIFSSAFSLIENNGLACNSAGDLFVADGNGNIYKLTPGGVQSTFVAGLGSGIGDLAFNSAGDLLVSDVQSGAIYAFTPEGAESIIASNLTVGGLAFNRAGDLFVAAYGQDVNGASIIKIAPDGAQSAFASSLLSDSFGLAANRAGDLFVGNPTYNYTTNGYIVAITPRGGQSTFASGLNPNALAFNRAGDLFVVDDVWDSYGVAIGSIIKFTPDGARSTFATGLNYPAGLAFNRTGELFALDLTNNYGYGGNIYEFTPDGARSTFASFSELHFFAGSAQLAFNNTGDLFATAYLQDSSGGLFGSIIKIAPDGTQTTFFAPGLYNQAVPNFINPAGLAFNRAGDLFVADDAGGSIYELTPDGTPFVFATGLASPGGLAFAPESAEERVYVGNPALPFLTYYAAPDGVPPLVIMGEYSPAGPLPTTTQPLPDGMVQEVKFYGQNYDFTLYALSRLAECSRTNEQTFRVAAAQHFSGTNPAPGTITLAVSNFRMRAGDFLAFAGIGPYYPQQPNDAPGTDATYEDATQPVGYDNDTATPPLLGEKFTVGINRDASARYGYIADNFGNQGRIYAIGVDVLTEAGHDHRRFFYGRDHDRQ